MILGWLWKARGLLLVVLNDSREDLTSIRVFQDKIILNDSIVVLDDSKIVLSSSDLRVVRCIQK